MIGNAHFSDLLRLELLIRYGGTWLDATVLLTGSIPQIMTERDLFMFQTPKYDDTRSFDNWFIIATRNNQVLKATRDALYGYWRKNNKVGEYFVFHIILKMAIEKYSADSDMIKIPCEIPLMMSNVFYSNYDEEYIKEIERITPIHKLSYKIEAENIKGNSYYERLRQQL